MQYGLFPFIKRQQQCTIVMKRERRKLLWTYQELNENIHELTINNNELIDNI